VDFDPKATDAFFQALDKGVSNIAGVLGSGGGAADVAKVAVGKITFRTAFTPAIEVTPFALGADGKPTGESRPSWLNPLAWIQPEVRAETAIGPQSIAPWGVPDDRWMLRLVALGAGVVALGGLWWSAKQVAKTAAIVGGGALALSLVRKGAQ
jgi:hypothetical protein